MFKTLEFGVRGIVQRHVQPEQLVDSLRKVVAGELQIGFGASPDTPQPRRRVSLTPREREIVSFLRQGMRNKQIAGEMGITEGTVKIYLFRLFHKLGVRNRFELARCGTPDQLQLSPGPPAARGQGRERGARTARRSRSAGTCACRVATPADACKFDRNASADRRECPDGMAESARADANSAAFPAAVRQARPIPLRIPVPRWPQASAQPPVPARAVPGYGRRKNPPPASTSPPLPSSLPPA